MRKAERTAAFARFVATSKARMDAGEAVSQPRWHHQWQPDELKIERDLMTGGESRDHLEGIGHQPEVVGSDRADGEQGGGEQGGREAAHGLLPCLGSRRGARSW